MKTIPNVCHCATVVILIFLCACSQKKQMIEQMSGHWYSLQSKNAVTVRTHDQNGFHFFKDSVAIELIFNQDHTVSGKIGNCTFKEKDTKYNFGILPPSKTGIEWIVTCGKLGSLFENDPDPNKEIELWISPEKSDHTREVEIRMTTKGSHFPMGGVIISE